MMRGIFRPDTGQSLEPGYYWCRNGGWEIIFIYADGSVDARGQEWPPDMSREFKRCELSGPIQPPDDLESYAAWTRKVHSQTRPQ